MVIDLYKAIDRIVAFQLENQGHRHSRQERADGPDLKEPTCV